MKAKLLLLSFSIALLSALLFSLARPAEASYVTDPIGLDEWDQEWYRDVYDSPDSINSRKWTMDQLATVMTSTTDFIMGPPQLSQTPTGPKYVRQGGALMTMSNLLAQLYLVQPASSVEYVNYLANNFSISRPAYAQGLGFQALSPVLSIWGAFRNIAYLAIVVVLIIIGLMIMFRRRINPQTVISIQDALPRIIVTIILITFSYAIAGLVIDLGELTTRIIGSTFKRESLIAQHPDPIIAEQRLQDLYRYNIFVLVNPLRNVDNLVEQIGTPDIPLLKNFGPLKDLTVRIVFAVAGYFIMFKIFFALIGPYVAIILSVVFAPFQLLLGALPSTTAGLTAWLKQLVANVAVFPATFAMLAIAATLKRGSDMAQTCLNPPNAAAPLVPGGSAPWCPPAGDIGLNWFPTTIGNWGPAVGELVAFGILFTIPKVVAIVQQALQIQPAPWAGAAGEEIRSRIARFVPLVGGSAAAR